MPFKLKFRAIPNTGNPYGIVNSVNGKKGIVVLNAADVGADTVGSAQAVQQSVDSLSDAVDQKANLEDLNQVRTLAQTSDLKIGTKADQVDLEVTQQQVEQNRLAILSKADQQALAMLALLVDTKANQAYVQQQIANLVGSAPEALNTIYELAAAIQSEQGLIDSLNQSVANRVRYDVATQALTEIQKQNARTNIDAEKAGTAAQLVSQITVTSIGAATAAQGAKANTALQSADVAPVALSGLFSSLSGQNGIFNVVFGAYALGSNTAIAATDTLGQMLGKLQAQINNAGGGGGGRSITWVNAKSIGVLNTGVDNSWTKIEFAKIDGMLWIRGCVYGSISTGVDMYIISNSNYFLKVVNPPSNGSSVCAVIAGMNSVAVSQRQFRVTQVPNYGLYINPINSMSSEYIFLTPTCLGELLNP